jgi:putative tryptophan/tyrosine transport system substrate-binding protein
MFKKPRKTVGLLLVMLWVALMLAACGDSPTNTPAATGTTAAPATTAAPVATTAAPSATTAAATTTTAAAGTTAAPTGTTAAPTGTTAAPGATTAAVVGANQGTGTVTACTTAAASAANGKTYRIGISVQNTIPDLQSAINGVKKGMEQCGFVEGKNVRYDIGNALGDIPALATIGRKFADDKVDIIVAVGTAALVNMYNTNRDAPIPIVFNSVTSPYAALPNVIKSPTDKSFITGVQALPPVEDGMKIAMEVKPGMKNLGIIYNPAETNAKVIVDEATQIAKRMNITLVTATIQNSGEVLTAAQSIVEKVDVFLVPTDVTLVNGLEALIRVAQEGKKPVVGLAPLTSARGVAVAVGLDYFDNGLLSARVVTQILDGKKPEDIAIERQPRGPSAVNLKAAELQGFKIPDSIVNQATTKYTEIRPATP